ncbi:unnamed protein product [Cyprideis torosa]|uniref:Uncharacterized protein n=1 Tax=Cyprideis torosa TaxID=163714 RepID=A0A7R8ZSM6_9CRUS|nr:unnamed protein product [Cyprideis torosa]CAG0895845.1 unnamed protein product [Cyprideis torosa]
MFDTQPDIISELGYPSEVHFITTEDGYILQLHRIPHGKHDSPDDGRVRTPIFLQHGLLCSSSDWVITGEEKGLAFLLADQGYDVWMGNIRGNTYSKGHTNPNISNKDYWSFSFDEHGKYDIPAMINHVKESTGQEKMFYVAHSMGTMMFWVANHYYGQEFANNFIAMFGLGPVSQLQNMVSPLRYIAPFADEIAKLLDVLHFYEFLPHEVWMDFFGKHACELVVEKEKIEVCQDMIFLIVGYDPGNINEWIMNMFGLNEFLPNNEFMTWLAGFACEPGDWLQAFCSNVIFLICGYNKPQLDEDLIPHIVGHTPAGTSTKNVLHFAQGVKRPGFHMFDYGTASNQEIYGQEEPPEYDLSKTTVPVFLYYGENDWLTVPRDVLWLSKRLPNLKGLDRIPFKKFNHLDFLWAEDDVEWLKTQLPNVVASFLADLPSFNHLDFLWAIDVVTLTYNDIFPYVNALNPNQ